LIEENQERQGQGPEYELLDTGVFAEDRYFDVFVEYAKSGPEDIAIRIEAFNRGPDPAEIHLLPQLWFRNTWAWNGEPRPDATIERRRAEADRFYAAIQPPKASDEEKLIQRQALAGMLWSKQVYLFDVAKWLDGDDPRSPPPPGRERIRNGRWRHLNSMRVL